MVKDAIDWNSLDEEPLLTVLKKDNSQGDIEPFGKSWIETKALIQNRVA